VVWGERLPGQSYCSVGVDNVMGARMATDHILEAGSGNPLFLGPPQVPEVDSRYRGFCDSLRAAGVKGSEDRLVETHFTYDSAYSVVSGLVRQKRKFDGLVCASDVIAWGATIALRDLGISVPDQINVCGFDDVALARTLTPPLTTVRQDLKLGAEFMVRLLFERMEGQLSSSAVIPANLIVRGSTRPVA
jgi:DNA-binding LacI/PurR family transcriptional regulator